MSKSELEQNAGQAKQPKAKRAKSKIGIVVGVAVTVVAVAGAGFWVWHEQPSFCSAMCHTSMDSYVATFEQPAGAPGGDKWGTEVATTDAKPAAHRGRFEHHGRLLLSVG